MNKSVESPSVLPQTTVNHQIQMPISTTAMPLRSSNKSFSNRLGMMMSSSQTQNSIVQQSKPISSPHQYIPQKAKSPVIVKQSTTISSNNKNQNELRSNEISPSSLIPKCKLFFCFD
jgi:hypothetical protein